jgi:antitoxin component of RelBE/YafQ-DinJ toxin-antitoxin module
MPKKSTESENETQLSARISTDFRKKIAKYCKQNGLSTSELVRLAVSREIGYSQAFHVSAEQEKMIQIIVNKSLVTAVDKAVDKKLQVVDATYKQIL